MPLVIILNCFILWFYYLLLFYFIVIIIILIPFKKNKHVKIPWPQQTRGIVTFHLFLLTWKCWCRCKMADITLRFIAVCQNLPAAISIPEFPQDVQRCLNAEEPVHKEQIYRNNIVGALYEMLRRYTVCFFFFFQCHTVKYYIFFVI